ncbi:VOC family protein [Deinococcus frigens]|uniref:VOC family protein n=1 Tax=Deinococcus frigens TaxID=249403 RepID=UPI00068994CC|nr:VOC family protein [Deinococcus frigens]
MTQTQTTAPVASSPMTICAGEPIWVELTTPTPQQARDFYAALFGWTYQISEEFGGYATAHSGGNKAAGISPPPPAGMDASSQWLIYFDSEDIVADAQHVKALGGTAFEGPVRIGTQGQAHHVTDPSGAMFGLWQDDQHGGFLGNDGPGRLVWAEVNTRDSASAVDFYSQLLNADAQQLPGADYHQLLHGETGFAGVSGNAQNWEAVNAGGWMVYFFTEDVDRTAQMAVQNGGKVLVAPFDMPYGRMAVLTDPAGAVFTVMNPQPAGAY